MCCSSLFSGTKTWTMVVGLCLWRKSTPMLRAEWPEGDKLHQRWSSQSPARSQGCQSSLCNYFSVVCIYCVRSLFTVSKSPTVTRDNELSRTKKASFQSSASPKFQHLVSGLHFSLVFCRVYMPDHSYVTIRSRLSASVQDILTSVTEKLQYSDEQPTREEALILVAVASSGGNCLPRV